MANTKFITCPICEHHCKIPLNGRGLCGVRQNVNEKIKLLTYGYAVVAVDPVEKKPLFHFLPGTKIFSIGTYGCNFRCLFCQNFVLSQGAKTNPDLIYLTHQKISPQQVIDYCLKHNIGSIAYTYNEPTVSFEYTYDIAKLAKKHGIKNVYVSNGFMSEYVAKKLVKVLDAINIDLKSFKDSFYRKICGGRLKPVLTNIEFFVKNKVWTEVTTLIIPGYNDSEEELTQIAEFLVNLSPDIPWHISRFFPTYKMINEPATPMSTLRLAYDIGKSKGLKYVYIGNISDYSYSNTYCPKCGKLVIKRQNYDIKNHLKGNKCPYCGAKISGIFV